MKSRDGSLPRQARDKHRSEIRIDSCQQNKTKQNKIAFRFVSSIVIQGRGEDWSTWTPAGDYSDDIDDDRSTRFDDDNDDGGRLTPQLSRTHAFPNRQLEVQANAVRKTMMHLFCEMIPFLR
jgi:hypothetical protein